MPKIIDRFTAMPLEIEYSLEIFPTIKIIIENKMRYNCDWMLIVVAL